MRMFFLLAAALGALTTPAGAQPRETVTSAGRTCTYPGPNNASPRVVVVRMSQNCPATYPGANNSNLPLPPTAQLREEETIGEGRRCAYEQSGTIWYRAITLERRCPLTAGMLPAEPPRPGL